MRRYLIVILALGLLLWGLFLPPKSAERAGAGHPEDSRALPRLALQILSFDQRQPIADARVVLSSPGGRLAEARSDQEGRLDLPFLPVADFLFRLRVSCSGFASLDYPLRGDSLRLEGPEAVIMIPDKGLGRAHGRLRLGPGVRSPVTMIWRWSCPGPGIRPGGAQGERRLDLTEGEAFELPEIPIGADLELDFGAAAEWASTGGSAALNLRTRQESRVQDLGCLELRVRSVEGRIWDHRGRLCAEEQLCLRLDGSPASPLIRTRTDAWGRYALLVPDTEGVLHGRVSLGATRPRLVELPWQATADRAADLKSPAAIPGF